jgi:membrane protease YdiL (CAAX protease family)
LDKPIAARRFQVPLFFFLAYLIAWAFWAPTVLKARGLLSWEIPGAETFGLFGSSLAALTVTGLTEGRAGIKRWVSFMTRLRMGWLWALIAIIGPVALSLTAVLAGLATGNAAAIGKGVPLAMAPLYLASQILLMLLTEEPGWRGFALPRLQERYGLLGGSLILGLLWGCWHLPLFLIPGRPQTAMPFIGLVISSTAATVLMAWVQRNAGSGLVSVLFHSAMNLGFSTLGTLTSGRRLFWICASIWVIAAVLVYVVTGLRRSASRPNSVQETSA